MVYFGFFDFSLAIDNIKSSYNIVIKNVLELYMKIGFKYYLSTFYSENIFGNEGIRINDDLLNKANTTNYYNNIGDSFNIFIFNK